MRSFDASDPTERAWASEVYEVALEHIQGFLLSALGGCAYVREICDRFELQNPVLCDDTILKASSLTQTEWRHRVDAALQSLKKQGIVAGGQCARARGLWCLVSGRI